jgi:ATP-dependent Clp protease ATP-binding subunit ClpA
LDTTRAGRPGEDLERKLHRTIVGQDEAIHHIVRAYQCYLTGFAAAGRPIANLLFLGPTGTGKTRVVEATAEALLGDPRAVLKIDCAEFQHSHEIAKLIGSPPGYLGHRETHPLLSQDVVNQYHTDKVKISFVLFDEIEKASDALWNLLLGILDKATLTLGDNRRVDFSNAMIFMTSNLGAAETARAWIGSISVFRAWAQRLLAGSSLPSSSTALTRSWCSGLWGSRRCEASSISNWTQSLAEFRRPRRSVFPWRSLNRRGPFC